MSDAGRVLASASDASGDSVVGDDDPMGELPIQAYPGESPAAFSRRLYHYTTQQPDFQGRTAALLASRETPFLQAALRAYVGRFRFRMYPIDMALRLFLAWERLPGEAQQVDRVLSVFAAAYVVCNPEVMSEHQAYLLAFSLVLLHTSTFNRSVRTPMSKADYVRIAEATEMPRPVLEYLFDNVTLVEFTHMYDATPAKRRSSLREQDAMYKLVISGELVQLRLGTEPLDTAPASAVQHMEEYDMHALHASVWHAPRISMYAPKRKPTLAHLVKMSAVLRRERNRWHPFGVILTGTSLLWFRDVNSIPVLESQIAHARANRLDLTFELHPDEVTPLNDAMCYEDDDTLCLSLARRRLWLRPQSDAPAWLASINYVAGLVANGLYWDDTVTSGLHWQCTLLHTVGSELHLDAALHSTERAPSEVAVRALAQGEARRSALAEENAKQVQQVQHYAILTPMQRATREKLEQAQHELLHTLHDTHWELAVLACRLQVLTAVV